MDNGERDWDATSSTSAAAGRPEPELGPLPTLADTGADGDADTPRAPRFALIRRMARMTALGSAIGVGIGIVTLGSAIAAYFYAVVANPGDAIRRETIEGIVAQESPVTYRDGTTRVGVFFERQHRRYVRFDELPRAWVMSIVAVEDRRFWDHWGFDPRGIGRALRDNLQAGAIVSGGSTLTQQTAKNLYDRPDRSLRSKGSELLDALRLEAHYEKADILEFYANQFHVAGNGRGLGIAARHFFDVEVDQLTVAECAFIAGMVKSPTSFDPFWGDDAEARQAAIARAHSRTELVLRELVAQPPEVLAGPPADWGPSSRQAYARRLAEAIDVQTEAKQLLADGFTLPFKRGPFRYDRSAALDEIERQLGAAPFDALLPGGIDDPRNAGVVVVTTLDPDAQREATYALWHHLTEVGTRLEGLDAARYVQVDHPGPKFDPDFPPRPHEFRFGRVAGRVDANGKAELDIDLGGQACRVDREALVRVAVAAYQATRGDATAKAPSKEVDAFTAAIPDGAVVLVSVRDVPKSGPARCDLELRPELQGAVTVARDGEILAMVGGNDDRGFNRALAPRQLGSTFKPLVFHAALALGWSPDQPLDNTRNVFPFSGTFYYPSPDHEPADRVSMAWAGTRSENLGSVWLLAHLIDHLDDQRMVTLATATDLAPRASETPDAYRARMTELGILATRDRLAEGQFVDAKREVLGGLAQSAHPEDDVALRTLTYGWGYKAERKRAAGDASKLRALDKSDWRRIDGRLDACLVQQRALVDALARRSAPDPASVREITVRVGVDGGAIDVACGPAPEGYARPTVDALTGGSEPAPTAPPQALIIRRPWATGGFAPSRRGSSDPEGRRGSGLPDPDDLLVDGVHASTLRAVREAVAARVDAAAANGEAPDPYALAALVHHADFRTLVAMRFVGAIARAYGVATPLHEVLSLPLGVSEITLTEATVMYDGLVTGESHLFPAQPGATASLIREVRSADGKVLFRSEPAAKRVATEEIGEMTADILRNVVLHGTGVRASAAIRSGEHAVPVGGKTGTTDDYRNAAFIGFVPASGPSGYSVRGGYVIGAYVGYDDNRPMVNGRIKLSGASGALPAWIGTASGLSAAHLLGDPPSAEASAGAAWTLLAANDLVRIPVDAATGLPVPRRSRPADDGDALADADPSSDGEAGDASVLVAYGAVPDRASRPAPRQADDAGRPERADTDPADAATRWWNRMRRRFSGR